MNAFTCCIKLVNVPVRVSLRGSEPEQADTLTVTIVCLITYLLTLNFPIYLHLEIFALIVPSIFNNLKSLKIIENRRKQKCLELRILNLDIKNVLHMAQVGGRLCITTLISIFGG